MRSEAELQILDERNGVELWGNKVGCTICNLAFEDSIENVSKHVKDHTQGRGCKVYKKNRGGGLLTEYAYDDAHHQRSYGGGDSRVHRCFFPRGAVEGTVIKCGACNWKQDFGKIGERPVPERNKTRALSHWRNHIALCRHWKPQEELVW